LIKDRLYVPPLRLPEKEKLNKRGSSYKQKTLHLRFCGWSKQMQKGGIPHVEKGTGKRTNQSTKMEKHSKTIKTAKRCLNDINGGDPLLPISVTEWGGQKKRINVEGKSMTMSTRKKRFRNRTI